MAAQPRSAKSAAAPKRSARKPAAAPAGAAPEAAEVKPAGLVQAGLKVLSDVREDVAMRRSRIFAALLGLDDPLLQATVGAADQDSVTGEGGRSKQKFEDVFDQRVARSLERLGMPSPQALAALCAQLDAINQHLARNEAQARPAPRKPRPRR